MGRGAEYGMFEGEGDADDVCVDPNVLGLWIGCEQKIYASLEA